MDRHALATSKLYQGSLIRWGRRCAGDIHSRLVSPSDDPRTKGVPVGMRHPSLGRFMRVTWGLISKTNNGYLRLQSPN